MRHIAVVSLIASLLAFACDSGQDAASKTDPKAAADEAAAKAKAAELEATRARAAADEASAVASEARAAADDAKAALNEPEPAKDDFGGELCNTIIPCYQKLEFAGSFVANVTADIEPDGSVSVVSFTGEGPKPVQTCITDAIKAIELADYNGKPGRVHCTKSGQLMGGTQMVMSDRSYEVRDAGAAPAEASETAPSKGL